MVRVKQSPALAKVPGVFAVVPALEFGVYGPVILEAFVLVELEVFLSVPMFMSFVVIFSFVLF